jgi:cell wall-associated NlpC family hydrolase
MMKKIWVIGVLTVVLTFSFGYFAKAQHYVNPGETMYQISKEHHMTLSDLISLNPHITNPNLIRPNDYIIIRSQTEPQKDLTDYARSLQSITAYVYGGQNFPYSTDCSGWIQGIYKKFGVNLPRTSREQATLGKHVPFKELQIGDLMFFSTRADKVITHVGINLGNDFFISNLNEEKDVEILSNWGTWSQKHFLWGARHEL